MSHAFFYLLPIDELERLLLFHRGRVNAKVPFFVQRLSIVFLLHHETSLRYSFLSLE
jgi:hypothetical protein